MEINKEKLKARKTEDEKDKKIDLQLMRVSWDLKKKDLIK